MTGNRVTIRDVAQSAGVSVTTVSDSLTGKGRLSSTTRRRIQALADELGYRPSIAARSLKQGRTGLLLMSVAAPRTSAHSLWNIDFFVHVMTSAAIEASTRGYALALAPMNAPTHLSFDGALVVDPVEGHHLITQATDLGLPVVTVGRSNEHVTSWVDNDYHVMVQTVLDHFIDQGATAPGLLISDPDASYVRDCVKEYTHWCARHEVTPQIIEVIGGLTEQSGREAAARLLSLPHRPDAIFATLDHLALGAVDAATDLGLRVPADVLVASLGDSEKTIHSAVPISALNIWPRTVGAKAAVMLIDQVEGERDAMTLIVPGEFAARRSTQRDSV